MYHDNKQYEKSLFLALAWVQKLEQFLPKLTVEIGQQHGVEIKHEFLAMGSFNCCYRLKGMHSILRFPLMCKSAFRYEKTTDECHIMTYISGHTSIPVPKLLIAKNCDLGPYMVTSFVDGSRLSDFLRASSDPQVTITLQPDIDTALLSRAYRTMATIMIELSKCQFNRIGALGQDESDNWCVTKRPVTLNMNQLVSCGNYPPQKFPQRQHSFTTANEYFTSLAEMHITHLRTQRNDAIDDAKDCRKKYVARHLFLQIARTFSTEYNNGPFPLYCDDMRPTNAIVNADLGINGVVDWEYCYAAPAEFTYCAPWWLLLTHPDNWAIDDLGGFYEKYLPRFKIFIESLREEEADMIRHGKLSESQRLSTGMKKSLENGHFWFCLAATSSFGFDEIFWKFIDPLYFGEFTTMEDRIHLLGSQEQEDLDAFVTLKLKQVEDSGLDQHVVSHEMFVA